MVAFPTRDKNPGNEIPWELGLLEPVARGIARTFGSRCEVVLHDLRHPESSLVLIEGSVTRRAVGAPVTDLVLELVRRQGDGVTDAIGYRSRTPDGRVLKSSTIFVRDRRRKVIGCLCINFDVSDLVPGVAVLDELVRTTSSQPAPAAMVGGESSEHFAHSIGEILEAAIAEGIKEVGVAVADMRKEDKLRLVEVLENRGIFLIKGAVELVAAALGVSRYTVYNYLGQARAPKAFSRLVSAEHGRGGGRPGA